MNLKHIEAVLKAADRILVAEHGGDQLISQGHIALVVAAAPEGAKDFPKLAENWEKWEQTKIKPVAPGGLVRAEGSRGDIYRWLDKAAINEAFFRCFDGPDVTWTETGAHEAVLVHENTKLIGVVMPVKWTEFGTKIESATDEEVFEWFACERNDYYAVGHKQLRKEIDALEEELSAAQDKAEEASEAVLHLENELARKQAKLDAMNKASPVIAVASRRVEVSENAR